ncbi:MAG: DNA topoisomerase I [Candidatus Pacearchaeota archaeon]|jgi:DNA topoisomerase-1
MAPKKTNPKSVEQSQFRVFNPEDIKQTVEIPVKPKPSIEELETIEKIGKKKPKKTSTKRKSAKKTSTKSTEALVFKEKPLIQGGYTLIITEKPQAAEKIAAALSNGKDKRINKPGGVHYFELERNKKKILIACAVGHLFSVSQSKKETGYPIFNIGWKPNYEVRKADFTKKYYLTILSLVKGASEIVIATDFDIEGEVIGYNIVRFIAQQPDAKRMKFSALTAEEIQNAYDNVHPTIEWGQAIAGETRHFLDWMYGINLSRALMSAIKTTGKFRIMSIGRVQGPALKMIVEKEKQIKEFKPTPYWQVFIEINDNKNKLELKHIKDIIKKTELDKFKELKDKKAIATTTKTQQIITPPAPFDLTTLQTEAYKFHGITPANTLQIAQKLYLAGLISYPRTSSQKIPEAMNPQKILKQLEKKHPTLTKHAVRSKPIEGNKSDPAHPAIIPTGTYNKLTEYDEKIYNLIMKRFVSCFCADAKLANKKVEAEVNNLKFNTRGMEVLEAGWMNVYPTKMEEKQIKDFNGEVKIDSVKIEEKETQPPKRYSPASIITELEKRNLGTKATRANIIETLYQRNYVKDKSIKATELGIKLIESMEKHSPIIIDEKLTREMEKDMEAIRSSKKELNKKQSATIEKAKTALIKISGDFKKQEVEIGKELIDANQALWDSEKEENKLGLKCPLCNKGDLTLKFTPRFKSYFIACSEYPNCKQTFPLPSNSLIKKTDKVCEYCKWPMLLRIKQNKRPWVFCPNPKCESKKELDINGNTKEKEPRYIGK